ncbi:MAG TPA: non-ribosomal peptide synthetase [Streptosporangiaceae bacterium]|nr:non-ribosomal peptide synthetase [Streptosporangiaceae bacterium]
MADAHPDAIAIDGPAGSSTHRELRGLADHVSRTLRERGVRPGALVGVALERSQALIASVLAVTKLGAAYVPIDPRQPARRARQVLDQAGCAVVVMNASSRHLADGQDYLDADSLLASPGNTEPAPNAGPALPDAPACVFFTSGSTGVPKGVAVTQRNLSSFVAAMDFLDIGPGSRVSLLTNPAFDVSSFEIWVTLSAGATLVIPPSWPGVDVDALAGFIAAFRVTTMFLTPSVMRAVVGRKPDAFAGLRHLVFGGEAADPVSVTALLRERNRPDYLINGYGPTEATTFAIMHTVPDNWHEIASAVPIGQPTKNCRAYVLDDDLRPVSPGSIGQIYLAGEGVTRGYLGAPGLTADRFVPCPFSDAGGSTMYRTGDLALLAADGTLTFTGRIDNQVKIRGNRVELAEVDIAMAALPGVETAAAAVWEPAQGDRRIVAAVVPATPKTSPRQTDPSQTGPSQTGPRQIDADELRAGLRDRLPEYMIPSQIGIRSQLPLSPNGKIDREAVARLVATQLSAQAQVPEMTPNHDERTARGDDEYVTLIAAAWEEVLRRPVQPDQNFFDVGGDSLLLLEVHARLEEAFGREIPLTDLLAHPTVGGIAAALAGQAGQPGSLAD